jgi:site-specific DNA-methyltransferase (adenine-specific)
MREIKVILGDCMEVMAQYPEKYFDLAVVDPPYGIDLANMNMGVGKSKKASKIQNRKWKPKNWDKSKPNDEYFYGLLNNTKNQIIWGGNYFNLPPCKNYIIWDKEIPHGLSFSDCEMAWTSFNKAPKICRLSVYLDNDDKFHPTQKPVALYDWIYAKYLPNGGKVLDAHGGSMSNVISWIKAGNIDGVCVEIDKNYFRDAKKRIQNFLAQQDMFRNPVNVVFYE